MIEAGGVANGIAGTPTATGTLTDTDVDNPANTFQAVADGPAAPRLRHLHGRCAGHWTYTLDNSNATVQALNVGGSSTDTFTVLTADGTAQQVTITINGDQRRGGDLGHVERHGDRGRRRGQRHAGTPTATGTLTDTDVDNTANTFQAVPPAASDHGYGTLHGRCPGGTGPTRSTTATPRSRRSTSATADRHLHRPDGDGTAQQVTVTINGDQRCGGDLRHVERHGDRGRRRGQRHRRDADRDRHADRHRRRQPGQHLPGGRATASDQPTAATRSMRRATGATRSTTATPRSRRSTTASRTTDTFTVADADGTAQMVTITINGTNDAAVISGDVPAR